MASQSHTAPQTDEQNEFEYGDYVRVTPFEGLDRHEQPSHVNVLYRVKKTFERERTGNREPEAMVVVETVLEGGEPTERAYPASELEPAETDRDATYLAAYRSYDASYVNRHTASGVHTLQPDQVDEFCPVCGSNAVRWANDPLAGVGGEWCDTCGYAYEDF